jgi:hypothetical protein
MQTEDDGAVQGVKGHRLERQEELFEWGQMHGCKIGSTTKA